MRRTQKSSTPPTATCSVIGKNEMRVWLLRCAATEYLYGFWYMSEQNLRADAPAEWSRQRRWVWSASLRSLSKISSRMATANRSLSRSRCIAAGVDQHVSGNGRDRCRQSRVVETEGLELVTHHPVIEPVSRIPESGTEIFNAETERENRPICRVFVTRDRANQRIWHTCL